MKDEHVVINKSKIERRIKILEDEMAEHSYNSEEYYIRNFEKTILEDALIDSVPLIPEIEKAYQNGFDYYSELLWDIEKGYGDKRTVKGLNKQDYISNLKLDI